MKVFELMLMCVDGAFIFWLQAVLILPVGRSVNSNISIVRFRHFHEEYLFLWQKVKVKLSLYQAMEAHRVVRR
jgi:hypothetical protein